jgi:hypothetical protein
MRQLEDAIGERRLAVVDVGDDREVTDLLHDLPRIGALSRAAEQTAAAPAP